MFITYSILYRPRDVLVILHGWHENIYHAYLFLILLPLRPKMLHVYGFMLALQSCANVWELMENIVQFPPQILQSHYINDPIQSNHLAVIGSRKRTVVPFWRKKKSAVEPCLDTCVLAASCLVRQCSFVPGSRSNAVPPVSDFGSASSVAYVADEGP